MRMALAAVAVASLLLAACGQEGRESVSQEQPPSQPSPLESQPVEAEVQARSEGGEKPGVRITGPFTHENLSIYFVEDPDATSMGEFITLPEGLKSGAIKVTEQKSAQVNQLLISNSSDKPCFVQAGDVVKGGQQDRTIARDFVIPPKSQPQPLASFCVEQGRWNGNASFADFRGNANSQYLKLAIQEGNSQSAVWKSVARTKADLVLNNSLSAPKSTSLTEEIEDPKIEKRKKGYLDALSAKIDGRKHAVGMIWAINGELITADVYGDPGLFSKLFPQVLESAALEARGVEVKADKGKPPSTFACAQFLRDAAEGEEKKEEIAAPGTVVRGQLQAEYQILGVLVEPIPQVATGGSGGSGGVTGSAVVQVDQDLEKFTIEKANTVRFRYQYKGHAVHTQSHSRRKK